MTPSNEAVEAVKAAIDAACGRAGFKLRPHALTDFATAALNAALPIIRAQVLEEAARSFQGEADYYAGLREGVIVERCQKQVRALKENHP